MQCIYEFRNADLLGFIENTLLDLKEKSRRCLAMYGCMNGLSSGKDWQSAGYDATNCIYAGVWKIWLMQHQGQHPYA